MGQVLKQGFVYLKARKLEVVRKRAMRAAYFLPLSYLFLGMGTFALSAMLILLLAREWGIEWACGGVGLLLCGIALALFFQVKKSSQRQFLFNQ